jgi:hypothetical protein
MQQRTNKGGFFDRGARVANAGAQRVVEYENASTASAKETSPALPIEESASELDDYRRFVERIADAADGKVIFNRSIAHAGVVISNIFRISQASVDILTGSLDPVVFGVPEVLEQAKQFVLRAGHVRIISEFDISSDHPLLRTLKEFAVIPDHQVLTARYPFPDKELAFHFALGDGRHFRFEPDKSKTEAFAQFGEAGIGGQLMQTFDQLWTLIQTI